MFKSLNFGSDTEVGYTRTASRSSCCEFWCTTWGQGGGVKAGGHVGADCSSLENLVTATCLTLCDLYPMRYVTRVILTVQCPSFGNSAGINTSGARRSAEEAVRREVFEEAGIRVGPVSIVGSQPWPIGEPSVHSLPRACLPCAPRIHCVIPKSGWIVWLTHT